MLSTSIYPSVPVTYSGFRRAVGYCRYLYCYEREVHRRNRCYYHSEYDNKRGVKISDISRLGAVTLFAVERTSVDARPCS